MYLKNIKTSIVDTFNLAFTFSLHWVFLFKTCKCVSYSFKIGQYCLYCFKHACIDEIFWGNYFIVHIIWRTKSFPPCWCIASKGLLVWTHLIASLMISEGFAHTKSVLISRVLFFLSAGHLQYKYKVSRHVSECPTFEN